MSGCSSCSSQGVAVAGCRSNGGCQTGGCNKLNVFDWLSNMDVPPAELYDVVEVRFKGGRKDYFRNRHKIELVTGDPVVVNVPNGHHIGYVSLQGELVRLQLKKRGVEDNNEIREIYRLATSRDLERFEEVKGREMPTMYRTREIVKNLTLEMKLSDVEFQADNTKATFYYSAEDRVDFRELIKVLAGEFKIRVEMRQISLRQEASRLGGIGSCGRELCCSTWLSTFKSVSTAAARYQNLSLNPSKLSGQCGRLKCCLNYELQTYMDALEDIPDIDKALETSAGKAKLQKTDIFRRIMWFGYENETTWHALDVDRAKEILEMNTRGEVPFSLEDDELPTEEELDLNSDLERMDKKFRAKDNKRKRKNRKKKAQANTSVEKTAASAKPGASAQQGEGQERSNVKGQEGGGGSSRSRRNKNRKGGGRPQQKPGGNSAKANKPNEGAKAQGGGNQPNNSAGNKQRSGVGRSGKKAGNSPKQGGQKKANPNAQAKGGNQNGSGNANNQGSGGNRKKRRPRPQKPKPSNNPNSNA